MNLFHRKAEISAAVTHISCYNRCWKPLCCLIFFVETVIHFITGLFVE